MPAQEMSVGTKLTRGRKRVHTSPRGSSILRKTYSELAHSVDRGKIPSEPAVYERGSATLVREDLRDRRESVG